MDFTKLYELKDINVVFMDEYVDLIRSRIDNPPQDVYFEKHHIFPVSIFGDNKETIKLTLREHFNAHWLLWKATSGYIQRKMANAVHMMMRGRKDIVEFTDVHYEQARKAVKEARTGTCTAYNIETKKYVKIKKDSDLIGSRYFLDIIQCQDMRTSKIVRKSLHDEKFIADRHHYILDYVKCQVYIDSATGDRIWMSIDDAKKNPERFQHIVKGTKCETPMKKTVLFNSFTNEMHHFPSDQVENLLKKEEFHTTVTVFDNIENRNRLMPSYVLKNEPDRYSSTNKGKIDIYDYSDRRTKKITKNNYDPTIHVPIGKKPPEFWESLRHVIPEFRISNKGVLVYDALKNEYVTIRKDWKIGDRYYRAWKKYDALLDKVVDVAEEDPVFSTDRFKSPHAKRNQYIIKKAQALENRTTEHNHFHQIDL